MGAKKLVSKKLGVGGGTIGALAWMASNSPEHTLPIAVMITILAIAYLLVEGSLDYVRDNKNEQNEEQQ